ncbi:MULTISPECIES: hypothetical protein [unclassified Bradyrhizobium]|uniref:hypothetical protein n=1 Tax=unclassified Bradyrhizobium TaxID=2631580 RepID=UPI002478D218|nr:MULTISPECIES: hypothetical protein [unclassified Bradyrhizobium]WGR67813.1 hypothetical protein MTX24_20300 [Bradyrhizobium sp. ISRA426]WGR79866.1 hypothetical protein MTX21_05415 [Bradyrhizobium sp. ISRA430]WGR83052.1 hypothetical protein MTX25_19980 [Bradyrhizobium sp. ISRA432]
MRSVLALALLISACSAAAAAPAHRAHPRPHAVPHEVVRPAENSAVPPGWYKFPGYPPIPPSENRNLDPSNYGGG